MALSACEYGRREAAAEMGMVWRRAEMYGSLRFWTAISLLCVAAIMASAVPVARPFPLFWLGLPH